MTVPCSMISSHQQDDRSRGLRNTRISKSKAAYRAAKNVLAGGVKSPVRAFLAVGGFPRFILKASGASMTDLDGIEYVDYVGAWGPMILGHADDRVKAAASKILSRGWSYGAPTELETNLAEMIAADVPSIELIRFVNSGTEATMSAIRLARGFTRSDKIVKCEGCYHGHADSLLVKAGSGATTFGTPSSAGVTSSQTADTLLVPYNNLSAAEHLFNDRGSEIAAFLIEPVAGNMGCVPPSPDYLPGLRRLCDRHDSLLIFDEVMTGYRLGLSGAQGLYDVQPDITCLGKIIGGGFPVGAYGGRRDIMEQLSPLGPVYQAGTMSGNPLAMAAGLATLEVLHEQDVYSRLESSSSRLAEGLQAAATKAGVSMFHTRVGSMGTVFFQSGPVIDYATALRCDTKAYSIFFNAMLDRGVYLPPAQYEAMFVSLAHTEEQIDKTILAAEEAFEEVAALKS